jgi:hypothetical protein
MMKTSSLVAYSSCVTNKYVIVIIRRGPYIYDLVKTIPDTLRHHGQMIERCKIHKDKEANEVAIVLLTNAIVHPWTVVIWADRQSLV